MYTCYDLSVVRNTTDSRIYPVRIALGIVIVSSILWHKSSLLLKSGSPGPAVFNDQVVAFQMACTLEG